MNRKDLIIKHIKDRLTSLEELGKIYSEDKINELATKLDTSDKTLTEINTLIDNKFSNQVRKINHNKSLASLREYYISSIDKLKKDNNCYLLSYDQGVKVLEQACLKEIKATGGDTKLVSINNRQKGYTKDNSSNNDYELIMSDIAYLLNINYARTYRIFDEQMNPKGVLNASFVNKNERFLNMEEALRFIKEESPKFTLTQELLDYHDKHIKHGLITCSTKEEYKNNLEYVLKLFKTLPDITDENIENLKREYLNMKIFELLTNSLNNNLTNFGVIVNKENLTYTYRLSPSYIKCTIEIPTIESNKTICNFYIVDKRELLKSLMDNFYSDIKEIITLILNNYESLQSIINQIIKEHLEYTEYSKYHRLVNENIVMMVEEIKLKKEAIRDSDEDQDIYEENDELYNNRIAPFVNNYVAEEYDDEKGGTIILAVITIVLFITIGIILLAVYALSKMQM